MNKHLRTKKKINMKTQRGKFDMEIEKFYMYVRGENCSFVLRLNVPVNNFSVMSGRSKCFLGLTSTVVS